MPNNARLLLLVFPYLLISALNAGAQRISTSPYSAFGVGKVAHSLMSRNFAMGGAGVGFSSRYAMNRHNPASYADLYRFTLDVSGYGDVSTMKTASESDQLQSGGFGGLSMVFKKEKPLAFAVGINPYSTVGYEFFRLETANFEGQTYEYSTRRIGEGGLTEAYLGVAFKPLGPKLSVGANVSYVFGELSNQSSVNLTPSPTGALEDSIMYDLTRNLSGFSFEPAILYQDSLPFLGEDWVGSAGLTIRLTPSLNVEQELLLKTWGNSVGGLQAYENVVASDPADNTALPTRYSVGLGITKANFFQAGLDFLYEDWSDFDLDVAGELGPSFELRGGAEIIPAAFAYRKFFRRIAYRAGGFAERTYLTLNNNNIFAYGFSAGFGIPVAIQPGNRLNVLNRINLGVEWSSLGSTKDGLIRESNWRFMLGVSFVEPWYKPPKYE